MPDKKLTDAEIVKGLECYRNSKIIQVENGVISIGDIFDLINRQKAEIEQYKDYTAKWMEKCDDLQAENERLKKVNLTLEKCCENCIHEEKTLQTHPCCECFGYRNFTPKDFSKQIKVEAYKEFAERFNKEAEKVEIDREGDFVEFDNKIYDTVADWCKATSNNLLKELVGDN